MMEREWLSKEEAKKYWPDKEVMEWISVKDKLPEDKVQVLVLVEGYYHDTGDSVLDQKLKSKVFQGTFNRNYGWQVPYRPHDYYPITHWMPLAEPPKD